MKRYNINDQERTSIEIKIEVEIIINIQLIGRLTPMSSVTPLAPHSACEMGPKGSCGGLTLT